MHKLSNRHCLKPTDGECVKPRTSQISLPRLETNGSEIVGQNILQDNLSPGLTQNRAILINQAKAAEPLLKLIKSDKNSQIQIFAQYDLLTKSEVKKLNTQSELLDLNDLVDFSRVNSVDTIIYRANQVALWSDHDQVFHVRSDCVVKTFPRERLYKLQRHNT